MQRGATRSTTQRPWDARESKSHRDSGSIPSVAKTMAPKGNNTRTEEFRRNGERGEGARQSSRTQQSRHQTALNGRWTFQSERGLTG